MRILLSLPILLGYIEIRTGYAIPLEFPHEAIPTRSPRVSRNFSIDSSRVLTPSHATHRRLNNVLVKNADVNDSNKEVVVETLRSIAELIIWGDQHDQSIIDYFFENQMLAHFQKILSQRSNRSVNDLVKQVLQTLSIMIQNIKSETSVYYLFSNNHINNIIRYVV